MNKKNFIVFLLIISLICTGCSNKKEETKKVDNTNITVNDDNKNVTNEKEETIMEDKENENTDIETNPTNNNDNNNLSKDNANKKNDNTSDLKPNITSQNEKKEEYTCPFGYTLEGNKCYKLYSPEIKYMCDYGESKSSICTYDTSVYANVDYSCPADYNLVNDICVKEEASLRYNPNEFNGLGSETAKISALNNFRNNCNTLGGTIRDNICYTYLTQYATKKYNCDGKNGILAGNKCVSVETKEAFKKYNCKDKDILTSNSMCRNEINATKK